MKEQAPRFTPEELIEARGRRSRWTGEPNYLTTDCPDCRLHLIHEKNETCEWGETWKRLVPREGGERACGLLGGLRPSPREERILSRRKPKEDVRETPPNIRVTRSVVFLWDTREWRED